jgi:hypothetical protein
MKVGALLHPEHPGNLDLGKNDVVWQSASQTVIKHLLRLRQRALHIERPIARRGTVERPEPRDDNEREPDEENKEKDGRGLHDQRVTLVGVGAV